MAGHHALALGDVVRHSSWVYNPTSRPPEGRFAPTITAAPAARVSAATALLDRGWGKPMQGHAVMAVAAPKSVREMTDSEIIAMMEKKRAAGG